MCNVEESAVIDTTEIHMSACGAKIPGQLHTRSERDLPQAISDPMCQDDYQSE